MAVSDFYKRLQNKSMDVRAKQLCCDLACMLNSGLREFGFVPRHLNRYAKIFSKTKAEFLEPKPMQLQSAVRIILFTEKFAV